MVLVRPVGVLLLGVEVGAVFLLVVVDVFALVDIVPVVDQNHVFVGEPHVAVGHVVEDDDFPVCAEAHALARLEFLGGARDVVGVAVAVSHKTAGVGPRRVGAPLVEHRRGRASPRVRVVRVGGLLRDGAVVEGNAIQRRR